ncbi:hypothetical protein [Rhizobium sp. 18065]|uniref:hypothetical protein n=1 Tax=Rhizobium sp. 18065 TaxID=2681411 RepID=UPI001358CE74|nr:hypothetical protein [Rhizobium sp. 18065]
MSITRPALSVPLRTIKTPVPGILGTLEYQWVDLSRTQKRFTGRWSLEPEIDLGTFTTRAVIDWLMVEVQLNRSTQFQWIQRDIEAYFDRLPGIHNCLPMQNDASSRFRITIQEPDIPAVLKAVAAIETKYGFAEQPGVAGIEISVDFTPRTPDHIARARMVRVLSNHLLVSRDLLAHPLDRPRTVWGQRPKVLHLLDGFGVAVQAPFSDGTVEFGAKNAEVRWRVMDKTIDEQNRGAGTFLALEETDKRARVEVTLASPELRKIGINRLNDLAMLNFTQLQGRYFRFSHPTFPGGAVLRRGHPAAMNLWLHRQRINAFEVTGNLGVKALDDRAAKHRSHLRKHELTKIHQLGLCMPRPDRTAIGKDGTFVAYTEMNLRVRTALRNLGRRVADGFVSGV